MRNDAFLSTLPARGATMPLPVWATQLLDFYPRSPRGERPEPAQHRAGQPDISIHAPREGSDMLEGWGGLEEHISIHAPREGSDDSQPFKGNC